MRVFLDSFQTQKNYNMAIYTSDHIGKWYWLRYDNNVILAEEFTTELTRAVSDKQLIQGDAGVHVMSVNGKTMTSTLSSDVLIEIPQGRYNINNSVPSVITPPFNPAYRDVLDLLIDDFTFIKTSLYNPDYWLRLSRNTGNRTFRNTANMYDEKFWYTNPRNLLSSASIQIGNTVRCTLNYNAYYDQIFNIIEFVDAFPQSSDFLARVAKNYDCRFYATLDSDQYLRILSASININIRYAKMYLANTESEYPLYSPQGYEVSGSITVPAKEWNFFRNLYNSKVVSYTNFSLLVGSRYLRLGQALIEDKINLSMGDNMMTAEISFKGFARL
jgi:hypothetical protein